MSFNNHNFNNHNCYNNHHEHNQRSSYERGYSPEILHFFRAFYLNRTTKEIINGNGELVDRALAVSSYITNDEQFNYYGIYGGQFNNFYRIVGRTGRIVDLNGNFRSSDKNYTYENIKSNGILNDDTDFSYADLNGFSSKISTVKHSKFIGAQIQNFNNTDFSFENCNLEGANLDGIKSTGGLLATNNNLKFASLRNSSIKFYILNEYSPLFSDNLLSDRLNYIDFSYSNLVPAGPSVYIRNMNLYGSIFDYAIMSNMDIASNNFSYCRFAHANLSRSILSYSNLTATSFEYADLSYANLKNAIRNGTNLYGANTTGIIL